MNVLRKNNEINLHSDFLFTKYFHIEYQHSKNT